MEQLQDYCGDRIAIDQNLNNHREAQRSAWASLVFSESLDEEGGIDAEVDAKGEAEFTLPLPAMVGFGIGTKGVASGKGVMETDMRCCCMQAAIVYLVLDAQRGIEVAAIETHKMARRIEVGNACLQETPQAKTHCPVHCTTAIEGPQASRLLKGQHGVRLRRKRLQDAPVRVPLGSCTHGSVPDGLHATVPDVLLATTMLDNKLDGEVKIDLCSACA